MIKRYAVGILDKYSGINELEVIEAGGQIAALLGVVYGRKPEVRNVISKVLLDHVTIDALRKYFADYWGLHLTEPRRLWGNE